MAADLARFHPALAGALVVDGHTDTPSRLFHRPADLSERLPDGHVDLPRLVEGGVTSPFFALFVPHFLGPEEGWAHVDRLLAGLDGQWRPGRLERVATVAAARRTAAAGAVGVLLGLENGRCLTGPESVGRLADLGVRYVTPTHVASHEWCDASTDAPRHGGLSDAGVKIVREMRRRGILVDVSHVSDDAALHALDALRGPVLASHSSARALCDHPRNLPDGVVREIAKAGGVVMANAYPAFLDPAAAAANRERSAEVRRRLAEAEAAGELTPETAFEIGREVTSERPLPPVPVGRMLDHLMHLVEVAGEEHVGIGTDFDGISDVPVGLEDVSRFPALVEGLLTRGLPPAVVRGVIGENALRVLAEAERRAG
ncbi:MAG TPA: membrane dipeptidase [Thermoanaerobaculia bacterium]|nr:membrane dipeptidase [Thermoanaerobaculia bacterium]